jgi:hypothetical protein
LDRVQVQELFAFGGGIGSYWVAISSEMGGGTLVQCFVASGDMTLHKVAELIAISKQGREHRKARYSLHFRYSSHCRVSLFRHKLLKYWSTEWDLNP